MLERRDDDLGLFRGAIRGIMIMAVITALIFAIICVYNKVVYGCETDYEITWTGRTDYFIGSTGSIYLDGDYDLGQTIYKKWWYDNKGQLPVRPINERKSHGNERAGKNESGR